jgi:RNase P subunit RPR2
MTVKSSNREKKQNVAADSERTRSNLSCKTCGHAFASFLEEMAEHNAKQMTERHADITCPKCGKTHDYTLKPSSPTTKRERSGNVKHN